MATCHVKNCTNPIKNKKRGLCNAHYLKFLRFGDVHHHVVPNNAKPCVVEGCDLLRHAKEYCSKHIYRLETHGSIDIPRPVEKHGLAGSPEYGSWQHMRGRCYNPSEAGYSEYGGRGVKVHPAWVDSFATFAADMGPCPEGSTLDRIDPNGNYEPSNCRWADKVLQSRNQRTRCDNTSGHKGVSWCKHARKWRAYKGGSKSRVELGYFNDREQAISARHAATVDDIGLVVPCCPARARLERLAA